METLGNIKATTHAIETVAFLPYVANQNAVLFWTEFANFNNKCNRDNTCYTNIYSIKTPANIIATRNNRNHSPPPNLFPITAMELPKLTDKQLDELAAFYGEEGATFAQPASVSTRRNQFQSFIIGLSPNAQ